MDCGVHIIILLTKFNKHAKKILSEKFWNYSAIVNII